MDTITHAVIGAVMAHATMTPTTMATIATKDDEALVPVQPLTLNQRLGIGALAAAFPDIDYATAGFHSLAFIAHWHRSITHSLVMLPLWVLVLGIGLSWLLNKPTARYTIMVIVGISLVSHIVADVITSWGTQILSPLSDVAPAWGTTFVIDPYFSALIFFGLVFAFKYQSSHIARWAIVILVIYVSFQAVLKQHVVSLGRGVSNERGWQASQIIAMPQPLSPFNWKLVIAHENHYHLAFINLLASGEGSRHGSGLTEFWSFFDAYRPATKLHWQEFSRGVDRPAIHVAWQRPEFVLYRRFAVLPFLYGYHQTDVERCAWFGDLRFILPVVETPFIYGMCQDTMSGRWRLYRLSPLNGQRTELPPSFSFIS